MGDEFQRDRAHQLAEAVENLVTNRLGGLRVTSRFAGPVPPVVTTRQQPRFVASCATPPRPVPVHPHHPPPVPSAAKRRIQPFTDRRAAQILVFAATRAVRKR